jgi:hypothetical protein
VSLYAKHLAKLDPDILETVVYALSENARVFPTMSEIREAYRVGFLRRRDSGKSELPIGRASMPDFIKKQIADLHGTMAARAEELEEESA